MNTHYAMDRTAGRDPSVLSIKLEYIDMVLACPCLPLRGAYNFQHHKNYLLVAQRPLRSCERLSRRNFLMNMILHNDIKTSMQDFGGLGSKLFCSGSVGTSTAQTLQNCLGAANPAHKHSKCSEVPLSLLRSRLGDRKRFKVAVHNYS